MNLKMILCAALFALSMSTSFAQSWTKLKLKYLQFEMSLPSDWEADGFGNMDDEESGSSVCNCAGIINIGNRFTDSALYMVVYPSRYADSIPGFKRRFIWDMKVSDSILSSETLLTKHHSFKFEIRTWETADLKNMEYQTVLSLTLFTKKTNYQIYFWGENGLLPSHFSLIDEIMGQFKAL